MPNFNTTELKVSITRVTSDGTPPLPLSEDSMEKLERALIFAANRSRDMLVVLAFPNYFIPQKSFRQVKESLMEKSRVEFLFCLSDLFVMRTQNGQVVTVKASGGSILFGDDEESNDESFVDITSPAPAPAVKKRVSVPAAAKPSAAKRPTTTPKRNNLKGKNNNKRKHDSGSDDEDMGELTQECLGLL